MARQYVVTRDGEHVAWLATPEQAHAQREIEQARDAKLAADGWGGRAGFYGVHSYLVRGKARIHYMDADYRTVRS